MKIYTLTIVYSELNDEVYEIEEEIVDERSHYEMCDKDLDDIIDQEDLMNILRYESTGIASA